MRRAFWRTERQRDANRRLRALNVFVSPSTQRLEQLTPEVLRTIPPWPFMFFPFNHFAERGPSVWNGPQNALARIRE
jgi:hypothetical protein